VVCRDGFTYAGQAFGALPVAYVDPDLSCFGRSYNKRFAHGLAFHYIEQRPVTNQVIDDLKTTALELQELIQNKVGTESFAKVYAKIRRHVLDVQHERRAARVTLVSEVLSYVFGRCNFFLACNES
jgi:hypothetical protein